MKTTLLLVTASLALATHTQADPSKTYPRPSRPRSQLDVNGPATLIPGVSIGPFKLGMTRTEIEKLGIAFKTPASSILITGPYEIGVDKTDHVTSIARRMATDSDGKPITGAVVLAGKSIEPKISFADLQKRIPGCKKPELLEGATVSACADRTAVIAAGPVGIVEIQITR